MVHAVGQTLVALPAAPRAAGWIMHLEYSVWDCNQQLFRAPEHGRVS